MVVDPYARTVTRLGQLVGDGTDSAPDADLLRRYVVARDEAAFAALVRRHAPMVFGVCRRTLGHVQDAEDAFQATFLVLARKAPTVRAGELSRWLYGVAARVAHKARVRRARRLAVQRELESADPAAPPAAEPRDWLPLLDTALAKLADRDRGPILLCDLLGRSRAEAAAELGIAEGTLSSRLARARDKLRARLARLGAALSLPTMAAGLADEAGATVPPALIQSTVVAGTSAAAARELAEGVLRTMFFAKLFKLSAVGVCLAGTLTVGVAWLPTAGADPKGGQKEAGKKAPPAQEGPPPGSDAERIQGTWLVESVNGVGHREVRGGGFDRGRLPEPTWLGRWMTFVGDRVEFAPFPGKVQTFRLLPDREPKGIDFTFRDREDGAFRRKDSTRPCIYRVDGDKLRIVFGDDDLGERPDSFEWTGKPTPFVHVVLRRPTAEEREEMTRIELANLQGTWLGVLSTVKGEVVSPPNTRLVVKGNRLRLDDPRWSDPLHATFDLNLGARPWQIDLEATADWGWAKKGEKMPGIVFRHGELLTLALGEGGPRPTSFEAAGRAGTVYTFVREGARSPKSWTDLAWPREAKAPTPKDRKEPAKPASTRLRELQKERVAALEEQMQGQFERVKIGKDPLIQFIDAVRELQQAELDLAETREQRLAAVEKALTEFRDIEKQMTELQHAGLQTRQGVAQARAARLKAEVELEKLKAEK